MTDLTENKDTRIALEYIISILSRSPYDPLPSSPLALSLMGAFHNAVQTATLDTQEPSPPLTPVREHWKEVFWSEVATVARALLAEQDLDDRTFTMQEWLVLRVLTISGTCHLSHPVRFPCSSLSVEFSSRRLRVAYMRLQLPPVLLPYILSSKLKSSYIYTQSIARPLLVLLQASFGLPASSRTLTTGPLENLPLILGLQNDLLGFDKDFATGNPLSAVQLLIRDGMDKKKALVTVVGHHNRLVTDMMAEVDRFDGTDAEKGYVSAASRWPDAMARWMLSCQRYKVT